MILYETLRPMRQSIQYVYIITQLLVTLLSLNSSTYVIRWEDIE